MSLSNTIQFHIQVRSFGGQYTSSGIRRKSFKLKDLQIEEQETANLIRRHTLQRVTAALASSILSVLGGEFANALTNYLYSRLWYLPLGFVSWHVGSKAFVTAMRILKHGTPETDTSVMDLDKLSEVARHLGRTRELQSLLRKNTLLSNDLQMRGIKVLLVGEVKEIASSFNEVLKLSFRLFVRRPTGEEHYFEPYMLFFKEQKDYFKNEKEFYDTCKKLNSLEQEISSFTTSMLDQVFEEGSEVVFTPAPDSVFKAPSPPPKELILKAQPVEEQKRREGERKKTRPVISATKKEEIVEIKSQELQKIEISTDLNFDKWLLGKDQIFQQMVHKKLLSYATMDSKGYVETPSNLVGHALYELKSKGEERIYITRCQQGKKQFLKVLGYSNVKSEQTKMIRNVCPKLIKELEKNQIQCF